MIILRWGGSFDLDFFDNTYLGFDRTFLDQPKSELVWKATIDTSKTAYYCQKCLSKVVQDMIK